MIRILHVVVIISSFLRSARPYGRSDVLLFYARLLSYITTLTYSRIEITPWPFAYIPTELLIQRRNVKKQISGMRDCDIQERKKKNMLCNNLVIFFLYWRRPAYIEVLSKTSLSIGIHKATRHLHMPFIWQTIDRRSFYTDLHSTYFHLTDNWHWPPFSRPFLDIDNWHGPSFVTVSHHRPSFDIDSSHSLPFNRQLVYSKAYSNRHRLS